MEIPKPEHRDFGLKVEMIGSAAPQGGVYRLEEDQEVAFRIEVERDAYVGVWNIAPDGTIVQLFPNDTEKDHLFRAKQPRTVPNTKFVFAATLSSGTERVWIVASTRPWNALQAGRQGPFPIFKALQQRQYWAKKRGFELRPAGSTRVPFKVSEELLTYRVFPQK